jgi:hypothetical protein
MARVRLAGITLTADPVEQKTNGKWLMRARMHTGRTSPGTIIEVDESDILEMAAAEMPGYAPIPNDLTIGPIPADKIGLAELEKGMAEERKTLPSPAELIAAHQKSLAEGKTPPGRPTQAPPSTAGQKV